MFLLHGFRRSCFVTLQSTSLLYLDLTHLPTNLPRTTNMNSQNKRPRRSPKQTTSIMTQEKQDVCVVGSNGRWPFLLISVQASIISFGFHTGCTPGLIRGCQECTDWWFWPSDSMRRWMSTYVASRVVSHCGTSSKEPITNNMWWTNNLCLT